MIDDDDDEVMMKQSVLSVIVTFIFMRRTLIERYCYRLENIYLFVAA